MKADKLPDGPRIRWIDRRRRHWTYGVQLPTPRDGRVRAWHGAKMAPVIVMPDQSPRYCDGSGPVRP